MNAFQLSSPSSLKVGSLKIFCWIKIMALLFTAFNPLQSYTLRLLMHRTWTLHLLFSMLCFFVFSVIGMNITKNNFWSQHFLSSLCLKFIIFLILVFQSYERILDLNQTKSFWGCANKAKYKCLIHGGFGIYNQTDY